MRFLVLLGSLLATQAHAGAPPPTIVAAENVYGDIARQIAGPDQPIVSIISNPNQDPHLFEADPKTARCLNDAGLVIANGAGYDSWIDKLLKAAPNPARQTIVVAELMKARDGANPHLWYDIDAAQRVAQAIAADLIHRAPESKAAVETRLAAFGQSLQPLRTRLAALRARHAGTPVTASEPVAGYLLDAAGLTVRNQRFQLAVMNDTEPSVSDTAAFEQDLRGHKVRAFLYNQQATDTAAQRLLRIAQESDVSVIGVTETEPAGQTYQSWMVCNLDALARALDRT